MNTMNRRYSTERRIYCYDCEAAGPAAPTVGEARDLAAGKGWLTGKRSGRVASTDWQSDYCPDCAPKHPRIYCQHKRGKTCDSRAVVAAYRPGEPETKVYGCGHHGWVLLNELMYSGQPVMVEQLPE